jgi:hypothetical protein
LKGLKNFPVIVFLCILSCFVFVACGELAIRLESPRFFNYLDSFYVFVVLGGVASLGVAFICFLELIRIVENYLGIKNVRRPWVNPKKKSRKAKGFKQKLYAYLDSLIDNT